MSLQIYNFEVLYTRHYIYYTWLQKCYYYCKSASFMIKKDEKNSVIEICPVRNVVARFGNKWAFLVILILNENGVSRFGELRKLIPDISPKVLSNTLKILEEDGFVSRAVYKEVPLRVEYKLTELGNSIVPIIHQLTEWAQTNMKSILEKRNSPK